MADDTATAEAPDDPKPPTDRRTAEARGKPADEASSSRPSRSPTSARARSTSRSPSTATRSTSGSTRSSTSCSRTRRPPSPASGPARPRASTSSSKFKPAVAEEVKPRGPDGQPASSSPRTKHLPAQPARTRPEAIELPEDGPFVYEFDVEVRPEFDLPDYKGLKLRRPIHKFTDADIEAETAPLPGAVRPARPQGRRTPSVEPTTSSSPTWSPSTTARN